MTVIIEEITPQRLVEYAQVSIAFEVKTLLEVQLLNNKWGKGSGGFSLAERPVELSYVKDYDVDGDESLLTWGRDFNLSNWGLLLASEDGHPVGGAAIAYATPEVYMLERRQDLAVLWDIRVQPQRRGQGVGKILFQNAVAWARLRGCRQMKIETQNVNVPACRFYAAMGCELGAILRFAYLGHPKVGDEIMLLWYMDI